MNNEIDNRLYEQKLADKCAPTYEKTIIREWGYRYKYITASNWGQSFGEPFLDFGCGTGLCSSVLESLGKEVVALDFSRQMIGKAKERCRNVSFVLADALNLPFRENTFQTICVIGVLHHILDLNKAFDELQRVSVKIICINEPIKSNVSIGVRMLLSAIRLPRHFFRKVLFKSSVSAKSETYQSVYERDLDACELIKLCEKRGFEILKIRYHNHLPFFVHINEKVKVLISKALVSTKKGTDIEIIARVIKRSSR
jgi:ubiquinone/menaquinone biosynthesis C-methylase UbiE